MSRKEFTGIFGLAVAGLAVGLATTAPVSAASLPVLTECTATVGTVTPRTDPVTVTATVSEPLGGTLTADVAEESKISVVSATRNEETGTVNLTLRTTDAVTGEWDITVRNDTGTSCAGKIRVVESPDNDR